MSESIRILGGGNIKLGARVGTFSKLYGNFPIATEYGAMIGTCGKHCAGCKEKCYVRKSYRYPSVITNHAKSTKAFRDNLAGAFEQLRQQLTRKRVPFVIVRINQSGEIESKEELTYWINLASEFTATEYYVYTKNFDALREVISEGINVPNNFTVLISVWHEIGIAEYMEWKHLPWIKAFIYMDGFDYSVYGLTIETTCKAYDEHGKLDHAVTCDKCKKCFSKTFKTIGCNEH